jgi:hypothetical protein
MYFWVRNVRIYRWFDYLGISEASSPDPEMEATPSKKGVAESRDEFYFGITR